MNGANAGKQIPLAFSKYEQIDFELFEAGQNQQVLQQLINLPQAEDKQNIYLWGPRGSGKSHLLQALCSRAAKTEQAIAYIPLKEAKALSPALLDGLEKLALVCLDDIDSVAADKEWEQAMFHLFNRMREEHTPMVMTSIDSPRASSLQLADLVSRLSWDLVYHLKTLDEPDSLAALQKRASARGFDLPDEVAVYLYRRVSRDMHNLFEMLDRLDQASLVAKKKLTIPFVKELLG